jgi:hypothetical protein
VRVASLEKPDLSLDLYGWTQPRFIYAPPPIDVSGFSVHQVRLGAIGGFGKWGRVQTELAFGPTIFTGAILPVLLLDAYGVFTPYRSRVVGVDVTLGNFRIPFSRQNLIQPVGLQLPDMAEYVHPVWSIQRALGGMLGVDFLDRKVRLSAGAFNGFFTGGSAFDVIDPTDPVGLTAPPAWFVYVGRLEVEPLGPAPRFEGDLREVGQRRRPVVSMGVSALKNQARFPLSTMESGASSEVTLDNLALEADVGVWFAGASLYGELLFSTSDVVRSSPAVSAHHRLLAWNVQAGYFPPLPFLREHVEVVVRAESSRAQSQRPFPEPSTSDLTSVRWSAGLNVFVDRGHLLKMQIFYKGDQFNDSRDDLLTLQATAGF